jgi:GT2 family glycosyltransferase
VSDRTARVDREAGSPVSIIIPTYQRQDVLCDTLRSVLAQDWPSLEIVVVDQTPGMIDTLQALLAEYPNTIRYERQVEPNLPRARNRAIALATTDTLLFIDDDVVLPPGFIKAHVTRLYASEQTGAVTGPSVGSLSDDVDAMMPGLRTLFSLPPAPDTAQYFQASWFVGCNVSLKRLAVQRAGPFDESFTGSAFCEDVDMAVRIRQCGLHVMFDRQAWLVHLALQAGGCETRNHVDAEPRGRERFQHLLYCRLKHASYEGLGVTARLLYRAYRAFALNRPTLARGPRFALSQARIAAAETWRAYQRVRATHH